MICLEGVSANVGAFRLGPLDLTVGRGEHVLLVGPSGAGKSLALELVAGFHTPNAGRVTLRGHDMDGVPARERRCGWVPQAHALFPHLSVADNIAYGLRAAALAPDERRARVEKIARRLEIEHLLQRGTPTLSGGERQRTALARALVLDFDILLLDEPFASLEPGRRRRFWDLVKELQVERQLAIVHATHDLREAQVLGLRVVVLMHGRSVQSGLLADIVAAPADADVAALVTPDL